jgi:hypothetical protein
MKTRSCVLGCVLAVVALLAGAVAAYADTVADIDFTSYASGNLIGQDGWTEVASGKSGPTVTNGVGAANAGGEWALKPLAMGPFSATTQLVATARFYNTNASDTVAGMCDANQSNTNWLPGFGLSGGMAYFRDVVGGSYNEYNGDALTMGDTYDIRMTARLSATGGQATIAYRDVTAGQTEFTQDSKLINVAMGLTPDSLGKYDFNALALRLSGAGAGISHYTITTSSVPEPSTLALVGTGVFGLLAYAWRKRK